jgi:hypothetical protein
LRRQRRRGGGQNETDETVCSDHVEHRRNASARRSAGAVVRSSVPWRLSARKSGPSALFVRQRKCLPGLAGSLQIWQMTRFHEPLCRESGTAAARGVFRW